MYLLQDFYTILKFFSANFQNNAILSNRAFWMIDYIDLSAHLKDF